MKLTPEAIHGFTSTLLLRKFADPKPTPQFHHQLWELVCDEHPRVAIAAPRGFAKSTAITLCYVLASILFRQKSYVLILSGTERQAAQFLNDIKAELTENEDLIDLFGLSPKLHRDTETIVEGSFIDGKRFRIMSKGASPESKVRGFKWRNQRPDLIVGDDMEDDEAVLNEERRFKFKQWFFNAVLPAGSDNMHARIVGTILHQDALLEHMMPSPNSDLLETDGVRFWEEGVNYDDPEADDYRAWKSVRYQAHNEDYSCLLWEEKFPKSRLKRLRQEYIELNYPEGYAQEYLNKAIDESNAFFRKEDLLPATDSDVEAVGDYYITADLAISTKDQRAYTVFVVGKLLPNNDIIIVDVRRFRGDSLQICEEMFGLQERYAPELFGVEKENISRSIGPFLYEQMGRNNKPFINLHLLPTGNQDKIKRARSIQARVRAGKVKFNNKATWWPAFFDELLNFPRGTYMDQVDAFAWMGNLLDKMVDVSTAKEREEEAWEEDYNEYEDEMEYSNANWVTGY